MKKTELISYLNTALAVDNYIGIDKAYNGLQVDTIQDEITTVAFAVDATTYTIKRAIEYDAQLLICHHGIYRNKQEPLIKIMFERVSMLLQHNIGLVAYHLPLDAHNEFGNNIQIIQHLIAQLWLSIGSYTIEEFYRIGGMAIWLKLILNSSVNVQIICKILVDMGWKDNCLVFGKSSISTIAVLSGAGGSLLKDDSIMEGIDLYLTGEALHDAITYAKESHRSCILWGHYETEVLWLQSLAKLLQKQWLKTVFIDERC